MSEVGPRAAFDRRQLGFGLTTDRLFRTSRVTTATGSRSVCCLTSRAQSARDYASRAEAAFAPTVLLVESMRGMPGVELEVFPTPGAATSTENAWFVISMVGRNRASNDWELQSKRGELRPSSDQN